MCLSSLFRSSFPAPLLIKTELIDYEPDIYPVVVLGSSSGAAFCF